MPSSVTTTTYKYPPTDKNLVMAQIFAMMASSMIDAWQRGEDRKILQRSADMDYALKQMEIEGLLKDKKDQREFQERVSKELIGLRNRELDIQKEYGMTALQNEKQTTDKYLDYLFTESRNTKEYRESALAVSKELGLEQLASGERTAMAQIKGNERVAELSKQAIVEVQRLKGSADIRVAELANNAEKLLNKILLQLVKTGKGSKGDLKQVIDGLNALSKLDPLDPNVKKTIENLTGELNKYFEPTTGEPTTGGLINPDDFLKMVDQMNVNKPMKDSVKQHINRNRNNPQELGKFFNFLNTEGYLEGLQIPVPTTPTAPTGEPKKKTEEGLSITGALTKMFENILTPEEMKYLSPSRALAGREPGEPGILSGVIEKFKRFKRPAQTGTVQPPLQRFGGPQWKDIYKKRMESMPSTGLADIFTSPEYTGESEGLIEE